jgi:arsenite methyltransferase
MQDEQNIFSDEIKDLAGFIKCLAHPARLSILHHLSKQEHCICNQIVSHLPLSQATVSQHLKTLKSLNLIKGEIEGKSICYCINKEAMKSYAAKTQIFLNQVIRNLTLEKMEKENKTTGACCGSSQQAVFDPQHIKEVVRERYAQVIQTRSCCGDSQKNTKTLVDGYDTVAGYVPSADYGLGCGIPTQHAQINPGDTVLDLGSGAGNDVFIVRHLVGESGSVIGLDFTDEMIAKANENKAKMGFNNTHFVKGEIENIPLDDEAIDVVVSNCVINLVPDKHKAFSEIYRVLKSGGHFCISDMVVNGDMEEEMRRDLGLYSGCIAGALSEDTYIAMVKELGFQTIEIKSKRAVITTKENLEAKYTPEKAEAMWKLKDSLFSINLFAKK